MRHVQGRQIVLALGALGLLLVTPIHAQRTLPSTVTEELYQQQYIDGLLRLNELGLGQNFEDQCQSSTPTLGLMTVSSFVTGDYKHIPYLTPPLVPARFDLVDPHGYSASGNSTDDVLTVQVKIIANSLWGLDHKTQSFKMKGAVQTLHVDCRLTHGYVGPINLVETAALAQIWMPTIAIQNQRVYDRLDDPKRDCLVYNNGLVQCLHIFLGSFFSKYDLRKMPFDHQKLNMILQAKFDSTTYTLVWENAEQPFQTQAKLATTGWSVDMVSTGSEGTIGLRPGVQVSVLRTHIEVERESFSLMLNAVLPAILYWFLSFIGFFLPKGAVPARAVSGVIPVLMLLNLNTRISASIPDLDYLPWILTYTLITTILTIGNFLCYAIKMWAEDVMPKLTESHSRRISVLPETDNAGDSEMSPQSASSAAKMFKYRMGAPKPPVMALKLSMFCMNIVLKLDPYFGILAFSSYWLFFLGMMASV